VRREGSRRVAVVQQHDGVDHEDHHRTDVDQDLEERDHVHFQAGIDAGQADHVGHQRQSGAPGLAKRQHQSRKHQGQQAAPQAEGVGHLRTGGVGAGVMGTVG
jgi:hypothetical protein